MEPLSRVTGATLDVLETLLAADGELYGLKVAEATDLKAGTVYPILGRLEARGWLLSRWETARPERGPRRRLYQFTPDGLHAALALLQSAGSGGGEIGG